MVRIESHKRTFFCLVNHVITGCRPSLYSDTFVSNPSRRIVKTLSVSGMAIFRMSGTSLPDEVTLAKNHRVHMLMAELGTFIHGCEISAITLTWQLPPLSGSREKQGRAKFEGLLKWNDVCAFCGGKLSLPGGSIRHTAFRVGTKDVRIGDYLTRSQVSNNRGDIYNCFLPLQQILRKHIYAGDIVLVRFTFTLPIYTIVRVRRAKRKRQHLRS